MRHRNGTNHVHRYKRDFCCICGKRKRAPRGPRPELPKDERAALSAWSIHFRILLIRFMEENNLTDEYVASKIDVDRNTIRRFITGKVGISTRKTMRLAEAIGLPFETILVPCRKEFHVKKAEHQIRNQEAGSPA